MIGLPTFQERQTMPAIEHMQVTSFSWIITGLKVGLNGTPLLGSTLTSITLLRDDGTSPPNHDKASGNFTTPTANVTAGYRASGSSTWSNVLGCLGFPFVVSLVHTNGVVSDLNPLQLAGAPAFDARITSIATDLAEVRRLMEHQAASYRTFEVIERRHDQRPHEQSISQTGVFNPDGSSALNPAKNMQR
jgi:hypothetical protein